MIVERQVASVGANSANGLTPQLVHLANELFTNIDGRDWMPATVGQFLSGQSLPGSQLEHRFTMGDSRSAQQARSSAP
jgi:hypothetical protein